jgi:cob(I)alamin adenosyltransferase
VKIYTKTGDDGSTGLFGGRRVAKDDARVDAYGTVDELNACLGVAASLIGDEQLRVIVRRIQAELLVLGADLATPLDTPKSTSSLSIPRITPDLTKRLEDEIDGFNEEVGQLTSFILPGGATAAATIHQCRSICRRAERRFTFLSRQEALNKHIAPYINRLSDHLFDLARVVNFRLGIEEETWSRSSHIGPEP